LTVFFDGKAWDIVSEEKYDTEEEVLKERRDGKATEKGNTKRTSNQKMQAVQL
jgi:hypothetical protein